MQITPRRTCHVAARGGKEGGHGVVREVEAHRDGLDARRRRAAARHVRRHVSRHVRRHVSGHVRRHVRCHVRRHVIFWQEAAEGGEEVA